VRFDVIQHPTAEWLSQQITEALPWYTAPSFLLRDRDALVFSKRVDATGIAEVVTAPGSSWQNAYVERVSARSAESVWTRSSSSTSAICVASFHRTWITTTALGHISPWTRIARNSGRYRRARSGISSPSLKWAGCIIDTSASRRDFFALTNDCRCSDRCGAVQTSLDRSKLASS
jgi:hypothetical protein